MNETVKALELSRFGGPEVFRLAEKPSKPLKPNEVRIRVAASGVNFADVMMRMGAYPEAPPLPFVPEGDDACVDLAPTLGTTMIGFRSDREAFADVRVRRAVAAALTPVAAAFPEKGLISRPAEGGGLLPPAMPGHDHHVSAPLDLEGSRALLAEAGHPGGAGLPRLRMLVSISRRRSM